MLTAIHPKLPMRDKAKTRDFYLNQLGFKEIGDRDYDGYLMVRKDRIQIHFFEFKELDPKENYGQVYIRTDSIEEFYQSLLAKNIAIHPNGHLAIKPWGQIEFSLLDPDNNLLTFGKPNAREILKEIKIRNSFEPGDIGFVIQSHGELYKEEYGYAHQFEQYVTEGIVEYLKLPDTNKSKVWICEYNAHKMGFLMLLDRGNKTAQLRYFFVYPEFRGSGIGNRLMDLFMEYLREMDFKECFLLTSNDLNPAAHLYIKHGFKKVEETESSDFGKLLYIQKYSLDLLKGGKIS